MGVKGGVKRGVKREVNSLRSWELKGKLKWVLSPVATYEAETEVECYHDHEGQ
jgi:hypothetical protein